MHNPLARCATPPRGGPAPPRLVAHGGGAVAGFHVSNTRDALDRAAAAGFRLVEVDLLWTTDGDLVALHDWDGAFRALFGGPPGPCSREAFVGLEATRGLTQLDLPRLATWLAAHPRVGVVTDVKTDRVRGLEVLARALGALGIAAQGPDAGFGGESMDLASPSLPAADHGAGAAPPLSGALPGDGGAGGRAKPAVDAREEALATPLIRLFREVLLEAKHRYLQRQMA